jgi:hypothetical protein
MVDAAETWDRDVTAHRPELGVDEATHNEAKIAHQRILQELQDKNGMFGSDDHPTQVRKRQERSLLSCQSPRCLLTTRLLLTTCLTALSRARVVRA